ncbi:hypothetical protein LC040_18425 [Bacillus tianshenii]|nr:hypothetical protein LC040_18425 [Bacillus tianshenii]
MNRNPAIALLLSIIPGLGHIFLEKQIRGIIYLIGFFLPIIGGVGLAFLIHDDVPLIIGVAGGGFIWFVTLIDMVVTLMRKPQQVNEQEGVMEQTTLQSGRFFTILLSFVPGLGHFQLGLMTRGFTFLVSFFGIAVMILFISFLSRQGEFFVFMGILPVLWLYSFFDALQLLGKKEQGEELEDRSIIEDLEASRRQGKKSKTIAVMLAVFPGAGHLYLGMQKRGLQLMGAFLLSIYVLDVLRLSLFFFLIPIVWFYSFFDALQRTSQTEEQIEVEDEPIFSFLQRYQKWIGLGLLFIGFYYLMDQIFIPAFSPHIEQMFGVDIRFVINRYLQTALVCILMIGGGVKLLLDNRTRKKEEILNGTNE